MKPLLRNFLILVLLLAPWRGLAEEEKKRTIAMTFDDGPNPKNTPQLLEVLKREGITATFFVVGKMAEKYPDLVRRIHQDGHEISNHTYNHADLTRLTDSELVFELENTRRVVSEIIGQDPHFFRPPGGQYNRKVIKTAERAGYTMVLWSDHSNDLMASTTQEIVANVVTQAEDEGVILMHNGPKQTRMALPAIFEHLRTLGFEFVTLSRLKGIE